MFRSVFCLIICCCCCLRIDARQETIDSLKRIINSKSNDTVRLSALNVITNYVDGDEMDAYNDAMIVLAEKGWKRSVAGSRLWIKYLSFLVEGYYNKGVFMSNRDQPDSSLAYYYRSMRINSKPYFPDFDAYCKMNIAIILTNRGKYKEAINLSYAALSYFEKARDMEGLCDVYKIIGRLYGVQQDNVRAIEFLEKAYAVAQKENYKSAVVDVLNKMATVNLNMKNYKKAIGYFLKAADYTNDLEPLAASEQQQLLHNNLGSAYYLNGEMQKAIYHLEKSIELAKHSKHTSYLAQRYHYLGGAYFKLNNYAKALKYGHLAMDVYIETRDVYNQVYVSAFLTGVYRKAGNYKSAYEYFERFKLLGDSMTKAEDKKYVMEAQLKYEFEKRELLAKSKYELSISQLNHEIEMRNQRKNIWIIILISVSLILVLLSFFIYKNQKHKTTIEIQNSDILKQRMMLAQMNPHFVFNSINSIQSFILNRKEKEAYSYLAKFSKLIRMILNNSEDLIVPLTQEIEALRTYVELEQLRFENVFDFEMEFSEVVEEEDLYVPPMVIQPYVENAIWHGLMNLGAERKGKLLIRFTVSGVFLKVDVIDNGIGRARAGSFEKGLVHRPMAMSLTKKRLSILNKTYAMKNVGVRVIDLFDEGGMASGTHVEIYLPKDIRNDD